MGKNFINASTTNPFREVSLFSKTKKVVNSKLNQVYKFGVSVAGVVGEKEVCITTGYKGREDYDNTFFLTEDDINVYIDILTEAKKELAKDKEVVNKRNRLYNILNRYIDNNWVKTINCKVVDTQVPEGYNPDTFKVVKISVEYIDDLPEEDINLQFNFIDVVHIPVDSRGLTMFKKKLSHSNENVQVNIIGFDTFKEGKKAAEKAMKDYRQAMKDGTINAADNLSMEEKLNYINSQN